MSRSVRIKRGLNIRLTGAAEKQIVDAPLASMHAVKPADFHGLTPKLDVQTGDEVDAGSPLFHNKYDPRIQFTSPVSGIVVDIRRGPKRVITEVVVRADQKIDYLDFGAADPLKLSREDIISKLLKSGLWPLLRQRPYDIIASPDEQPNAIFISAMDTHPLAGDCNFALKGQEAAFQTGINTLTKLTEGKVHLNVSADPSKSDTFQQVKNVQINTFSGPHPAGNVGVQIHHISPINKGDLIWYLNPQDVVMIGRLFEEGFVRSERVVALVGSEVNQPKYYRTLGGSAIESFTKGQIKEGHQRFISGNVLTGTKIEAEGFLGYYDTQVTVIPEGDEPQFFLTKGWLGLGFDKFSLSRSFPTWFLPKSKKFTLDTNLNGEYRAFVVTGQYEQVFPFDIYPVQLLKAIMAEDIEAMENLGIYEVAPEDFALCEYVCTSKINSQMIVRQGLDKLKAELT